MPWWIAAQCQSTDVRVRVDVGDQRLQRMRVVVGRRRDVLDQCLEQGLQVAALLLGIGRCPTGPGVRVQHRELDLMLFRVEVQEQFVDLIQYLLDPCVGPIDLVHDQDDR